MKCVSLPSAGAVSRDEKTLQPLADIKISRHIRERFDRDGENAERSVATCH